MPVQRPENEWGQCTEMITITTTQELDAFCRKASSAPYVTVDTEFMRDRTYFSKLCLGAAGRAGNLR